jgi:hypothetical protein
MNLRSDSLTACIHATLIASLRERLRYPERHRWRSYRRRHRHMQP